MIVLFSSLHSSRTWIYVPNSFIMDKIFHKFGLSGKSFIPMLIGTGCNVPGIMASRTIESESNRKLRLYSHRSFRAQSCCNQLISRALFPGSCMSCSRCTLGIAAVIVSGIILKKAKLFSDDDTVCYGASRISCSGY